MKACVTYKFDILILGAGGAGLMAACRASEKGFSTAVISKVPACRSHTIAAKGGINAALGNVDKDDWRWHMYDTIRGSDWLADQDAVEYMCRHAKEAILDLERMGLPFSRMENGKLYQRVYGGQSSDYGKGAAPHRACAVADRTGHAILTTLIQNAMRNKVRIFEDFFIVSLLIDGGLAVGVIAIDIQNGEIVLFEAANIIIATGGYGQVYDTNTSSSICTGDGNAMALDAGLPLQDMEFVQFHPTGLYGSGFLISEAARGEGAYLLNGNGERFMQKYAPKYMELAARDLIARSMSEEIAKGFGAGKNKDYLLLSLTHLDGNTIEKLPGVCEIAKTFSNIDVRREGIPVLPSAHYTMGGIPTNMYAEVLDKNNKIVPGLFAIGEAASTSVHGANRLGCNSLLDLIVFGKLAIERISEISKPGDFRQVLKKETYEKQIEKISSILYGNNYENIAAIRNKLKQVMNKHAGIFRNDEILTDGVKQVETILSAIKSLSVKDKNLMWNNDLIELLELKNLAQQGMVTLIAAKNRKESRGAHYRNDFPKRDDSKFLKHSIVYKDENDSFIFSLRNVRVTTNGSDVKMIKPEVRSY